MNSIQLLTIFMLLFIVSCETPPKENLTLEEVKSDLAYLDNFMQQYSSYASLNGYDYQKDFEAYLKTLKEEDNSRVELGLFLEEMIGKLGDRHASIKGYDLPNARFLPFTAAPYQDKVIGLEYDVEQKQYFILHPQFPYLKSINGIPIYDFLKKIRPDDLSAPAVSYHTRAVKRLKYMEENYAIMQKECPAVFDFVFTNDETDTLIQMPLETERNKHFTWAEKVVAYYGQEEGELNDAELIKELIQIDDNNMGYVRMSDMVAPDEAPLYFEAFHQFMTKSSPPPQALIIDIRGNNGGSRDLVAALAQYVIHPDSIYVVNVAQQRGELPLSKEWIEDLNNRNLYAYHQVDTAEKAAIDRFNQSFEPMYKLDDTKFSEMYYMVFNGQKITKPKTYFSNPVYILGNEKCFSASSILFSVFKGLDNVTLVGVNTDGSSGNKERFELPHSKLKGKISTMVSFQKDGQVFDGIGTQPDIVIERNLEQILWQSDYQLEELKRIIINKMENKKDS